MPFPDAVFDCVVCFGSVLSHLGEEAETGARELVRATKTGGLILFSVNSAQNWYLPWLLDAVASQGLAAVDAHVRQGTELADASGVPWRSFSQEEIEALAETMGCEVVSISRPT